MAVEFTDIETRLVAYLAAELNVRVATRVPNPRPTTWLQVRRAGGHAYLDRGALSEVFRDFPLVDVIAWSDRETTAHSMAMEARGLILSLPRSQPWHGETVYTVSEFSGPFWDDAPDPGMPPTPRMWATYEISTRVRIT